MPSDRLRGLEAWFLMLRTQADEIVLHPVAFRQLVETLGALAEDAEALEVQPVPVSARLIPECLKDGNVVLLPVVARPAPVRAPEPGDAA